MAVSLWLDATYLKAREGGRMISIAPNGQAAAWTRDRAETGQGKGSLRPPLFSCCTVYPTIPDDVHPARHCSARIGEAPHHFATVPGANDRRHRGAAWSPAPAPIGMLHRFLAGALQLQSLSAS
jgi:hypothetical protein